MIQTSVIFIFKHLKMVSAGSFPSSWRLQSMACRYFVCLMCSSII